MQHNLVTLKEGDHAAINAIRWWHRIPIGLDAEGNIFYTPGEVKHGPDGGDWPTTRFGMPNDLAGKRVLDVGAWDGFFSFEAEKRGALTVVATDNFANHRGISGNIDPTKGTQGFEYAKHLLGSKVIFQKSDVQRLALDIDSNFFDIVLCYGVLYHIDSPLGAIRELFKVVKPGGVCLIETAIAVGYDIGEGLWILRNGYEGDPTNKWYPSYNGLVVAAHTAGFGECEMVWCDGKRITVKLTKP